MTTERRISAGWRTTIEAAITGLLALLLSLWVFGPLLRWISSAWAGGDMLSTYVNAEMWSGFAYRTTTQFGFPLGMNLNYFPGIDITENTFAQIVTNLTEQPFLGINLLVLLSFPLVAVLAYLTIRIVGLRGPLAIAFAVAFTMIPFHWGRALGHTYLSTLYSLVIGLALALLIGSGAFAFLRTSPKRRVRVLFAIAVIAMIVIIAWTGIYYAVFSLIFIVAALLWRFARRTPLRELAWEAAPLLGIAALVIIGFLPAVLTIHGDPPLVSLGERTPFESVIFAGSLFMALLPLPQSVLPGMSGYNSTITGVTGLADPLENTIITNHGTWITSAALAVFLVALIVRSRRGASEHDQEVGTRIPRPSLSLIAYFIIVAILFFVPWGLNLFLAQFGTPQIRAWNRLLPLLLLLFLLGGAVALRGTRTARTLVISVPLGVLILGLVTVDSIRPFKEPYLTSSTRATHSVKAAREYATAVNAAIPGNCGILQLPYMAYPENMPLRKINDYDHFWTSLTNPSKSWSYGAVKNTDASVWAAQLPNVPSDAQVPLLREGGFCAIHLDTRGLDAPAKAATRANLTQRFGAPVATGLKGRWELYSLGAASPQDSSESSWSAETASFFHQPLVTADPVTVAARESALETSWWWTTSPESAFTVTPTSIDHPVTLISGKLGATTCAQSTARITVTSASESQTQEVTGRQGFPADFSIRLTKPSTEPVTVTVSTSTPGCPADSAKVEHFSQVIDLAGR